MFVKVMEMRKGVCVFLYFTVPLHIGPKGHGSGSDHFPAFKPNPVLNYMRVKPGLPDLLLP